MFEYKYDVESETLPTGRTYFTPDGKFPSITTVLGKTANQAWLHEVPKKQLTVEP